MSHMMVCSVSEHNGEGSSVPTIYRCRAPIASVEFMEEIGGAPPLNMQGALNTLDTNNPVRQPTPGLRYRNLGKSGLRVSNIGLGTWSLFGRPGVDETEAESVVEAAFLAGINVFDLSEAHSGPRAEIELGNILSRKNWKRSSFVVITKIYFNSKSDERGLSRKHIIESVKASLSRLQLDYIDIVIVHKCDQMCPTEETVRAMNHIINQGWAMYWGTAKWTPVEIMEAYSNCRQFNCITPITEQAEYHMLCREKAELYMAELYNKIGVGLIAWSPISMGLVAAKPEEVDYVLAARSSLKHNKYMSFSWSEDETQNSNKDSIKDWKPAGGLREVEAVADKLGCSLTQLSIAWASKNDSVQCLLIGATSVAQLTHCVHSLQLVPRLNAGLVGELERALGNKPARAPPVSTLMLR